MSAAETEWVVEAFRKGFSAFKDKPMVLYGVGLNTRAILENVHDHNIVGLMDPRTTGERLYGLKVLDLEEVRAIKPVLAIIARQSVLSIIYQRICDLEDEGIEIYDFQGHLLGREKVRYDNEDLPYWSVSGEDLKKAILENDIISFDIFDTLLMRRVLLPSDVFDLVEAQLRQRGISVPFVRMRVEAEKDAGKAPSLEAIYAQMRKKYGITARDAREWMTLESETDRSLLLPRHKMRELFRFALDAGKKVYLLSDMYYPGETLSSLLEENGYSGWSGVIVSCEAGETKEEGTLFDVYINTYLRGGGGGTPAHRGQQTGRRRERGAERPQCLPGVQRL